MRFRPTIDLSIYAVHIAFWGIFITTRLVLRSRECKDVEVSRNPAVSGQTRTVRFSRAMVAFHGLAFGVLFFGLGQVVIPGRVPDWFTGQRLLGLLIIASGAMLMSSALVHFRSWRVRAKLDEDHQLATTGPFRLVRHPIYLGMNLLALGTAIWVPTMIVWIAVALMAAGGDVRARAEEALLDQVFGLSYRQYRLRTWRFLPGVY